MLAIRLQRTGRKGHAQFRVIVQDSRRSPSSGNVVAALGNYDPHTKAVTIDTEKAAIFLNNGAQPSPRVAMLLQKEGVKLPSWVKIDNSKHANIKNTEKLRRNQTAEPVEEKAIEEVVPVEAEAVETPEVTEVVAEETPAVEAEAETPVEEVPAKEA